VCATPTVVIFVVRPGIVLWVHGSSEETWGLGFIGDTGLGWDDEKLGRNEVELER
jgi:hypothetical protein